MSLVLNSCSLNNSNSNNNKCLHERRQGNKWKRYRSLKIKHGLHVFYREIFGQVILQIYLLKEKRLTQWPFSITLIHFLSIYRQPSYFSVSIRDIHFNSNYAVIFNSWILGRVKPYSNSAQYLFLVHQAFQSSVNQMNFKK